MKRTPQQKKRTSNKAGAGPLRIPVSEQIEDLLSQIAETGLMGNNP
jgi:hypothetical protein